MTTLLAKQIEGEIGFTVNSPGKQRPSGHEGFESYMYKIGKPGSPDYVFCIRIGRIQILFEKLISIRDQINVEKHW